MHYTVEVRGVAREVYYVEADSEEEAMENWATGDLVLSEVYSCDPVEATVSG